MDFKHETEGEFALWRAPESGISFKLLDGVRAIRDGADLRLGSPQQSSVLAFILLTRGPVSIEQMADALWGEAVPPSGLGVIRTYLSRLRVLLADNAGNEVYTGQVVRETLRLYPPNWSLAHVARDDAMLGGTPVPKGTLAFTSQWATHRDARWYRDPEEFRPERWDPAGEAADLPEYAWFPFGGGPRGCPGNHYARMKAVLVLAVLAQRVRLDIEQAEIRPYPGAPVPARVHAI